MAKKTVNIVVSLLIVLLVPIGFARYLFWEPSGFTKDSWIYWLKVPSDLQTISDFSPIETPTYLIRNADGTKNSVLVTDYLSTTRDMDVFDKLESPEWECGFLKCEGGVVCMKEQGVYRINVMAKTADEKTQIHVSYEW
uniref:hypothetical protein n=1 Tax=Thaumasiovibrio occultus TaxID=1891184 RepID=UPI000B3601D3|nr:hypothetical protein [Thaumasiovibrio occultus]